MCYVNLNILDRSERFLRKLLSSDRIGYERALALQKLGRDQDAVFAELKYHLAWNVINRTPVFMRPANMSGFISDVFSGYGELFCRSRSFLSGLDDSFILIAQSLALYFSSRSSSYQPISCFIEEIF
jgi:hypothetical protein